MEKIMIGKNIMCKSILFMIICSVLVPNALAQDKIVVNTNRLTTLDDPSGWVAGGSWGGGQTARGNQMLGEQTTIKWYAFVIDQNGTAIPGVSISTNLRFPNGTLYYSTTGTTNDNGTVEFSKNLDNLNQRPYFATSTEGSWRVDVSATVDGQPISSNTRFVYDEIGCGKSGSGCHKSQDWQSSGASTKNLTNGGTFVSASRNSPYVQNRDKIHGVFEGHGHVDVSPPISSGECTTCHRSYNGTYTAGSARQGNDPQYPGGVHQNQVNCTQCHGTFATEPDTMVLDMPIKKCYDCHPQQNDNLTVMDYVQDPTNSYSYNPLTTSNTIKGHNGGIPCITCHNNGHNITKPYLDSSNTITEYQQCLTCHSTYQNHDNGLDCTVCHSQDAHIIKILSQDADYIIGRGNPQAGNCTNCHQDTDYMNTLESRPKAGSYGGDVPQIGVEFNHSTGQKWTRDGEDPFWSGQAFAPCIYCHGDVRHNDTALGKIDGFKGGNNINTYGTWCGLCHYNGNTQYSNMLGAMGLIPPEITGDDDYGNYSEYSGYFDHSGISGFQDSTCRGCHGSRPSLTNFVHNAGPGTEGGPDCVSCHNVGGGGDQPHVNVSAMNGSDSIHKDLNNGAIASVSTENKRCWACHGNGTEPEEHPGNYKTPYNCTDCHTGSNRNFTPDTIKVVSEHYWNGGEIITSGVSSCYQCHNRSEMMIVANDPDIGTVYGGLNNGDNSTSHYGKKRTDLIAGSAGYCNYCHNSTIDSFFDVFVDVYNTDIQNHSRYGTNPPCQNCHDSSSGSRIHDSELTFSELTLPTSTICLECHGPGGTASIKDKNRHNGTVQCSVCHLGNGKDVHPIKYLNNTGGFGTDKITGVKCDRCHESGLYNAPAIGKVQHSTNRWNGSLWNASRPSIFWNNNSLDTACSYCHGDTKHNTSAIGRVNTFKGSNTKNVFGTWCGICHYQGNSQFGGMVGVMSAFGVPPEISKHATYGNYPSGARDGGPYFNHSLNTYNDARCGNCHYSGTPPNLTKLVHNNLPGGESCLGCHSSDVNTAIFGKHANVSKVGSGVTDDDCKGCHFNVLTLGQMVPGYANYSNTYFCQDCHNASGRNPAQYANITTSLRVNTFKHANSSCDTCHIAGDNEQLSVRQQNKYHPNGPNGTAKSKNCYKCHYNSYGAGNTLNNATIGLNDSPFNAPGEDHRCNLCHPGVQRPRLTGTDGCQHCHNNDNGANNHYIASTGGHDGGPLTISTVTVDSPIAAGTIANVNATISDTYTQITKAQYKIMRGTTVIKDWTNINATDGRFNERIENINGRINTAGLATGIYNISVRGMSSGAQSAPVGGINHDPSMFYYPDNGVWTNTVIVTMNVTGSTMTWSGWIWTGGTSTLSPSITAFNNKLYAIGTGMNKRIYVNSMDMNGVWSGWSDVSMPSNVSASITAFNNRLYAMAVGMDNKIYINSLG